MLGIGELHRHAYIAQMIIDGKLKTDVANRRHAHSDYLGAFQSRGVPGLLIQLLIYLAPMLIFLRGLAVTKDNQLFASLAGVLMTIGYATYSLTEVPMHNGLPLVFYIITTGLCIGIVKHSRNDISADYSR